MSFVIILQFMKFAQVRFHSFMMCQFPWMVSWYMSSRDLVLIRSLIRRKKETISETLCGVECSDNGRRPNKIYNGIKY